MIFFKNKNLILHNMYSLYNLNQNITTLQKTRVRDYFIFIIYFIN